MNPNNKSFFGIKKNIKIHLYSDAYKNLCNNTNNTINFEFPPPSNLLMHLNKNGEIEYSILEGIVFPIGSLSTVWQTLICWISDLPTDRFKQKKINDSILDQNKINVENNTEEDVLDKKQIVRRMVGANMVKTVRIYINTLYNSLFF